MTARWCVEADGRTELGGVAMLSPDVEGMWSERDWSDDVDGYGCGDSYGDGEGYGYGRGDGRGHGDGYGNGLGDGHGGGYGNSSGDGYCEGTACAPMLLDWTTDRFSAPTVGE